MVCLSSCVSACGSSRWPEGLQLLEEMQRCGVANGISYRSAMRNLTWPMALRLFEEMVALRRVAVRSIWRISMGFPSILEDFGDVDVDLWCFSMGSSGLQEVSDPFSQLSEVGGPHRLERSAAGVRARTEYS